MTLTMKLLAPLALWTVLLAPGLALAQVQPTGTVDSQRAALATEAGTKASETLKKLFDSRQADLAREQDQLQKERDALDKERSGGKNADAVRRKIEDWQLKVVKLQASLTTQQEELKKKEASLFAPINRDVGDAVMRIAAARGFGMIVERSAVPYARADLDITNEVIAMVNERAAKK